MNTNLKKQQSGFTIIEVLIVLAIAGLILLIVFLAVPALQRNSRNTQRRNDVSKVLGLVQEATNNNNGTLAAGTTAPGTISSDKYSFYDLSGTSLNYAIVASGTSATLPANVDANTVIVRNNLKCNSAFVSSATASPAAITSGTGTTNVVTTAGATARTVVSIYAVEGTGNNIVVQCTES